MGELVRYNLGTRQEKSEDILKRIANDMTSPDCNTDQLEGKYYFAETADDVGPRVPGAAEPDHPFDQVATLRSSELTGGISRRPSGPIPRPYG